MDLTPRRVMHLTRGGFKDAVLSSNTIWVCSSCYSCTVECPKEIRITDIMYALKRLAIEEKTYPAKFAIPVLARAFHVMVAEHGRVNESRLAAKMFLKTQPLMLLRSSGLGRKLMARGRFSLKQEHIEQREDMRELINGKFK